MDQRIYKTEATGSAVYIPRHHVGVNKRTSDSLSVYTVELYAILIALEWMNNLDGTTW